MTAEWTLAGCLAIGGIAAVWPDGARRRLGGFSVLPSLASRELAGIRAALASAAAGRPRRLIAGSSALAAVAGLLAGGPVAALVVGVWGALAVRAATRGVAARLAAAERARTVDDLGALAADLRAGLPPAMAVNPAAGVSGSGRIADLTAAVWRLAEQTGAPAADLVERIEADARGADRARASAAAQAAGAQATALLLAALPVGGIALGYAIGTDPLRVLLHTPIGAACAVAATFLQCAGLLWSERLTNGPAR